MTDPRRWALAVALGRRFTPADLQLARSGKGKRKSAQDRLYRVRLDGDGYDLAEVVIAAVEGAATGAITEPAAWDMIMTAARNAQRRYGSWRDLADGYAYGYYGLTDGRAGTVDVDALLADSATQVPWDTNLDPLRQRWCVAIGAPIIAADGGDPQWLGGRRHEGKAAEIAEAMTARLRDGYQIESREQLLRSIEMTGGALQLARAVAIAGYAVHAGMLGEADAWPIVMAAGKLAQQRHAAWADFSAEYEAAYRAAGGPTEPTATQLGELARGLWQTLPWDADLDVVVYAAGPVLVAKCPRCDAQRTRPSPTPFVYCDRCALFLDHDFARATQKQPQPSPTYRAQRAQLESELALAGRDRDRHRAIRLRMAHAYMEAFCPERVSIRTRDSAYAQRYIAWVADVETALAFDAEAQTLEATLRAALARVAFIDTPAGRRVAPAAFRPILEAALAYDARRDTVLAEQDLYTRHPDGAPRELAHRIERAELVLPWLPVLDPTEQYGLIQRAKLAREYTSCDPPATHVIDCAHCARRLAVVADAIRVVCHHCGHVVDAVPQPTPPITRPSGIAPSDAARRFALALARFEAVLQPSDLARDPARTTTYTAQELESKAATAADANAITTAVRGIVYAAASGVIEETRAWALLMHVADAAQRRYASWREYGEAYAHELDEISDGRANEHARVTRELNDPASPGSMAPWETSLLPMRQRFALAIAAPLVVDAGGDPQWLAGARFVREAADALAERARERLAGDGIATTNDLIAAINARFAGAGNVALDLARVVAAVGHGVHARIAPEEDAWHIALVAARRAQLAYTSWRAFGDGFERAWQAAGKPVQPMAMHVAALHRELWAELPWDLDLDVALAAEPTRVPRVACPACKTPRDRPSPAPYVYCDRCAALVDYDLARASQERLGPPPARFVALRTELAPALEAARAAGDRDAFHALELRAHAVFVEDWPAIELPARIREAGYRERYIDYLSAVSTAVAFDPEARALEAAMHATTGQLAFDQTTVGPRVRMAAFRVFIDAAFAYDDRRHAALRASDAFARHPDGAPPELLRRIDRAALVRGWLPVLEPADAQALLERAGVVRESITAEPPPTREATCPACTLALVVVKDARRVVCAHCGAIAAV